MQSRAVVTGADRGLGNALPFFLTNRDDEDRLAMVDYLGREWPW